MPMKSNWLEHFNSLGYKPPTMLGNKEKSSVSPAMTSCGPWALGGHCAGLPAFTSGCNLRRCPWSPLPPPPATSPHLWKPRDSQSLRQTPHRAASTSGLRSLSSLSFEPGNPSLSRNTVLHPHTWVASGLCQTKAADCLVLFMCQEFIGAHKTNFCSWGNCALFVCCYCCCF